MSAVSVPGVKPNPYLSSAILDGDTLYLSGNVGVDTATGQMVEGSVAERTTQAMKNIGRVVQAVGMGLGDLVTVTIYLSNYTNDFEPMNQAYIAAFPPGARFPARTCIGVAHLPKGTDIEISCIASKKARSKL
ncbi:hypothetical protein JCM10213_003330 [Rhodosporidiobolus nylandii]